MDEIDKSGKETPVRLDGWMTVTVVPQSSGTLKFISPSDIVCHQAKVSQRIHRYYDDLKHASTGRDGWSSGNADSIAPLQLTGPMMIGMTP